MTTRTGENRRGAARRLAIVDAARRAALARGSAGARLRDIAETAEVSPGAILYHYPQVDDLLAEVFQTAADRLQARCDEARDAAEDAGGQLLGAIDAGLPSGPDDEDWRLLAIAAAQADVSRSQRSLARTITDLSVARHRATLEVGAAQGTFALTAPAASVARNLVALEESYGRLIVLDPPPLGRDEALELLRTYVAQSTGWQPAGGGA